MSQGEKREDAGLFLTVRLPSPKIASMLKAVEWKEDRVRILDQTRLPGETAYIDCQDVNQVAAAIRGLVVRGAPAIGIAAAFGIALVAHNSTAASRDPFLKDIGDAAQVLRATRPTAVSLFVALNRMVQCAQDQREQPISAQKKGLLHEAEMILREDIDANLVIGKLGAALIHYGEGILTYCNTGALATGGYGTALGIIRSAWEEEKNIAVYVCETRPLLQGARLTAWELQQEKIPVVLITDSMAGQMMRLGKIQRCIVGADRIAANGDLANKIGTYTIAILAKEHKIPFYVAATTSTIDFNLVSGDQIRIEERDAAEVTTLGGKRVAPEGITVSNLAFDITPAKYIRAYISEKGIFKAGHIRDLRPAG